MPKFMTSVKLNDAVQVQFEAESAGEVQKILGQFAGTEPQDAAPAEKPVKRKPRTPKSGIVGHIGPVYGEEAPAPEPAPVNPDIPQLTSLAEIADAIRNYARQPGVGIAGVTKLIQEFTNEAGETAKQVKDIAPSEFPKVSARIFELMQ